MRREEAEALVLERMWNDLNPWLSRDTARDPEEYEVWYLTTFEAHARIVSTLIRAIIDESGAPRWFVRLAMWLGRRRI